MSPSPSRRNTTYRSRPAVDWLEGRTLLSSASDLDPSFGVGGKVQTDIFHGQAHLNAIARQSDGKVVAVGDTTIPVGSTTKEQWVVARYNADGSLDGSFDSIGINIGTTFFGGADSADAVAIQPDGKILVGGVVAQPSPETSVM